MPCCMRSDACAPPAASSCAAATTLRHALLCGALAERHGAQLVAAIDRRVTNRNLVLCGGGALAARRVRRGRPPEEGGVHG